MDEQLKELRDLIMERDQSLHAQLDEQYAQVEERDRWLRVDVEERFKQIHQSIDGHTHNAETGLVAVFQKSVERLESTVSMLTIRISDYEQRVALTEECHKNRATRPRGPSPRTNIEPSFWRAFVRLDAIENKSAATAGKVSPPRACATIINAGSGKPPGVDGPS